MMALKSFFFSITNILLIQQQVLQVSTLQANLKSHSSSTSSASQGRGLNPRVQHTLRICNAYPYDHDLQVLLNGVDLLPHLKYKGCADFVHLRLVPGDRLRFKTIIDHHLKSVGLFEISDLPGINQPANRMKMRNKDYSSESDIAEDGNIVIDAAGGNNAPGESDPFATTSFNDAAHISTSSNLGGTLVPDKYTLLLVVMRHSAGSNAMQFESHVFRDDIPGSQVAVIDAYRGRYSDVKGKKIGGGDSDSDNGSSSTSLLESSSSSSTTSKVPSLIEIDPITGKKRKVNPWTRDPIRIIKTDFNSNNNNNNNLRRPNGASTYDSADNYSPMDPPEYLPYGKVQEVNSGLYKIRMGRERGIRRVPIEVDGSEGNYELQEDIKGFFKPFSKGKGKAKSKNKSKGKGKAHGKHHPGDELPPTSFSAPSTRYETDPVTGKILHKIEADGADKEFEQKFVALPTHDYVIIRVGVEDWDPTSGNLGTEQSAEEQALGATFSLLEDDGSNSNGSPKTLADGFSRFSLNSLDSSDTSNTEPSEADTTTLSLSNFHNLNNNYSNNLIQTNYKSNSKSSSSKSSSYSPPSGGGLYHRIQDWIDGPESDGPNRQAPSNAGLDGEEDLDSPLDQLPGGKQYKEEFIIFPLSDENRLRGGASMGNGNYVVSFVISMVLMTLTI